VVAFVRALSFNGYRVTVVTDSVDAPDEAGVELLARIPSDIHVVRAPQRLPAPNWLWSPRLERSDFRVAAASLARVQALHHADPFSAVIASGPPFLEFVVGTVFSRQAGVPLLLDFRDEWSTNELGFVHRGKGDSVWERLATRQARAVVCTTGAARAQLAAKHGRWILARSVVIRNGWDAPDVLLEAPPDGDMDGRLPVIGFYGNAGPWWNFGEFFGTLGRAMTADPSLAGQVEFRLVGRRTAGTDRLVREFPVAGTLRAVDHVAQTQAWDLMRSDAGLLLPNGPQLWRVLPGKLFDYLAARRPILLYGEGGEAGAVLQGYPGLVGVGEGDAEGLARAIRRITGGGAQRDMLLRRPEVDAVVQSHRRSWRDEEFLEVVRRVTSAGAPAQ